MSPQYNCPMCNGEGKVSVQTYNSPDSGYYAMRVAFAALFTALLVAAMLAGYKLAAKSDMERCAASCGAGSFKSWTDATEAWIERTPINERDISHAPVAGKCECLEK